MRNICAILAVAMCAGAAAGQVSTINSLNDAGTRWFNDLPSSNLAITNNGLGGIRWQETNTATTGFANRHHAALAVNGANYQFGAAESWQLTVTGRINGPLVSEAGIWIGTAPFYPSSFQADVGNFVLLPGNGGEIASFGGRMPFFSNNQPENNAIPRATVGSDFLMQIIYVGTADGGPFVRYGVNGVFTAPLNAGGTFQGWADNSLVGVYTQNNFAFNPGQADVQFSNISIIGIPAPSAAGVMALGGLVALRRRR